MDVRAHVDDIERQNREDVARAEREALARGKEPFDLAAFERLLLRGPQASRAGHHRGAYYLFNPDLMTIAEYAALLQAIEPWEDSN